MKTLEEKRQYWHKHVSTWQRSGVSQAAYCRQHGLIPRQLGYWVRHDGADGRDTSADALTLVPARVQPAGGEALVLQNGQGWQLALPAAVSTDWLAALLRGLS